MCLGIPGQIVDTVDAEQYLAKVDVSGVRRTISVRLLADQGLEEGHWVLVHVGFAMARIDEEEAITTLEQIKKLEDEYESEMEAFISSSL